MESPTSGRELAFGGNRAKLTWLNFFSGQLLLRHRYFLAVLAGFGLATAFPKFDFAGAAWVAPALILACAYRTRSRTAFRIGYVAGLTFYLTTLYWLLRIPVMGFPIFGWLAMSAFLALYLAVWVWLLAGRLGKGGWLRRSAWTLAGAAAWVALELIRARFLTGFPWNNLGTAQWGMLPLIQIASVTGVYGVSFIVVWFSLAMFSGVVAMFRHPTSRYVWMSEIILPLLAVLLLFVAGMSRLRSLPSETQTLRVTFIQPAIPQTMIWDAGENSNRFRQLLELTAQALTNETDLLLWPEAALPEFNATSFAAITNLIQAHQVEMIFGADDVQEKSNPIPGDRYDAYNAAFHFRPDGSLGGIYHKRHLVMFGEYIPLGRALPFVKWFTPITGGFTPGDRAIPFRLERRPAARPDSTDESERAGSETGAPTHIKIAPLICFEDTFPHLVREYVDEDTDFLVNLTNNGWFGESASQWQHAASAALRAVENSVPLLRCCNNGVTCWIDARGQVREVFRDRNGSEYGAGFVTWEIPILAPGEKRPRTFYNEHGDWFAWGCVAVTGLLILPRIKRRQRSTING
ncbi:MAG: apolipoprotein N-acyltransferase [Verrucomicrobia subdivision 3 bacterium]|nr:apolipoprotein N-acyltransferase [Limisphaerales bacterium]